MHVTLVNPPTLHRGTHIRDIDPRVQSEAYYRKLLRLDASPLPGGQSSLPGEHLGLQSLAASLRVAGSEVLIVNGCLNLDQSLMQTIERIPADTDVVGITGTGDLIGEIVHIARGLRTRGFEGAVIVGHEYASLNDVRLLENFSEIDFVIRGQGERPLVGLIDRLASWRCGTAFEQAPPAAVSYRRSDGATVSGRLSAADDVSRLPLPVRDDLDAVIALGMSPSMYTKRGCVYNCSFCTTGSMPAPLLDASAGSLKTPLEAAIEFGELAFSAKNHHITIVDDLFVGRDPVTRSWAAAFAESLLGDNSTATWMADVRVDSIDVELFTLLRRAGLSRVFIGVETASGPVQKSYSKRYSSQEIVSALGTLERLGIEVLLGFIMFSPFESLEGVLANLSLLRAMKRDDYQLLLQELRLYPGTRMERQLTQAGLLRGVFPHLAYDYSDDRVAVLAKLVKEMSLIVDSHGKPFASTNSRMTYELFQSTIEEAIQILKEASDTESNLQDVLDSFRIQVAACLY